jgi:hypothetical protein
LTTCKIVAIVASSEEAETFADENADRLFESRALANDPKATRAAKIDDGRSRPLERVAQVRALAEGTVVEDNGASLGNVTEFARVHGALLAAEVRRSQREGRLDLAADCPEERKVGDAHGERVDAGVQRVRDSL